ncbi:Glycine--tRNA ligase beta subunit, partial [Dissostichus eleginoides]
RGLLNEAVLCFRATFPEGSTERALRSNTSHMGGMLPGVGLSLEPEAASRSSSPPSFLPHPPVSDACLFFIRGDETLSDESEKFEEVSENSLLLESSLQ